MALVSQRPQASGGPSPPATTIDPFTTVNNGGARPLKAITPAELATLKEGDVVYVMSFRDYWKWLPTSTITSNDTTFCAPTTVGAGAGRFERLVNNASPDWRLQALWFVDSTAANQEGDGSALSPVKTDVEITRRLGPDAKLYQPTVIRYINTNTITEPSSFDITLEPGASIKFLGTSTTTVAAVFSAVTLQNRGTQTGWDVTGPGLSIANVGQIIEITASAVPANVGAYATILKEISAGRVRVSPFGKPAFNINAAFTNVTPAVGDSFVVHTFFPLHVAHMRIVNASNAAPADLVNCAVFDLFDVVCSGFQTVGFEAVGTPIFFQRVMQNNTRFIGIGASAVIILCGGGTKTNGPTFGSGLANLFSAGILATLFVRTASRVNLFQDCNFQAPGTVAGFVGSQVASNGSAFWDRTGIGLFVANGQTYTQNGAVPDWGTGNTTWGVQVASGGQYVYTVKPTINSGLGVGRETLIGGTDKLYAAVPYIEGANNAGIILNA